MNALHPAGLARRLFGSVRREGPSDELRARILAAGRAELERARGGPARAPDEVSELASTGRQRMRGRRWVAVAAFAAAAASLVAYLSATRALDPNVLISAERTGTRPQTPSTQPEPPTQIPIPIPSQTPIPSPTPIPIPSQTPIPTPIPIPNRIPTPTQTPNRIPIPSQTPVPAPPHSLGEQLEQIKRARAALRAGDHQHALELIDAYRALPTGGELGAESSLLRIEALALSGQRDRAAREARQFASDYPNSPLIDRALSYAAGAER